MKIRVTQKFWVHNSFLSQSLLYCFNVRSKVHAPWQILSVLKIFVQVTNFSLSTEIIQASFLPQNICNTLMCDSFIFECDG